MSGLCDFDIIKLSKLCQEFFVNLYKFNVILCGMPKKNDYLK